MKTENKDLINKGVMIGIHFSTIFFNDYFKDDFRRKLNSEAPLKELLLLELAEVLVGDDIEKAFQLFEWATSSRIGFIEEVGPELIEDCIDAVETSKSMNLN
ncbi:MAG: hypothetical protein JNL40_07460 [Cyclobacteriaceae bacterium]|nr:hypothetical protein [Cyclobacteriaceae bacterium]